jgi:hypothetical protein
MTFIRSLSSGGLLMALAVLAGPAAAVEPINFDVRYNADLAALCSASPTEANYTAAINYCHGVGIGIVRYHEALAEGKGFQPLFCFPDGVTRNQVMNAYVAYSKAHPEYAKESVGDVMLKFLIETYPCGKAATGK